ncbi:UDP-4-amino-4,6-dideoxy-N-acetyl-beta-L-altrosamine N-acetyltransferase [Campylobacter sp. CNRCH_2014_2452]|uniref:UDP-4-amino-4, 6-dideoxy-N-acetyl-beta-L-altrosamine N-acetyltransferase n=1 Tax=Campylobacter sp. CNRCH_2014_2452 TaxID=2911603 RepID=UPI00126D2A81|nr:UDP-4-amino-4,6-dideoxy-N-acetyl-beta-L-altrosamine N-acetyltransferase [Campylobacter sp. CNRCH_2014_2452]EAK0818437.1 UDP-4-amino-4,6-dideoxy-N-acetyl-beta-L-altrosamine N-acetyltransferase [Campylobacter lari]EAK9891510.1 UDP-4-amino-4,6-dideoxy-N-acetyl-beta-L-altrosamine N-acetyltransferase [Campylobacter lari]EGK8025668.1 UDP-4-amino-4,6-dideoxy-N-acetyl-beta-L-altrosamine N-acetyltransferase [Campylobacter lari]MCV3486530.1 UDP-4-amino-4,6-dideoxy-N-acetyl-beta-L-altrosamine N-acetylt
MIFYKNFTNLTKEEKKEIFYIRNSPNISKFMKTKNINYKNHLIFLKELNKNKNKKYFLLIKNNEKLGVIYFNNIIKLSCEFGLYGIKKGVGELLMQEVKNYAFNVLKVQTLNAYVFKENIKALNLYLKHGFEVIKEDNNFYFVNLNNPHGDIIF